MYSDSDFEEDDWDGCNVDYDFDQQRTLQSNVQRTAQNLKVTVVPDIRLNAGLDGADFDTTLTSDVQNWFDHVKETWKTYKKGPIISNKFAQFYATRANPFEDALKLFANCSDIDSARKESISFIVLEELARLKKSHGTNLDLSMLIDDNLRMVAYNFGKAGRSQFSAFKLVVETFDLVATNRLFVDKINELVAQHNYKDACQTATELKLFEEFTVYDFVFPLILQDKLCTAETYMEHAMHLQRPLVELLDSLLDRSSNISQMIDGFIGSHGYQDLAHHKLQKKTMSKLVKRLAKLYKIVDPDAMPNVSQSQTYGQLQFLLHKNYTEKSLSKESWREMVHEIIPKTSTDSIKLDLLHGCILYEDLVEAYFWARHFGIEQSLLPDSLQEYMLERVNSECSGNGRESDEAEQKRAATAAQFHSLPSDKTTIILVDNRDKYADMLEYLSDQSIVGIDAEWKPISRAAIDVALIQIGTRDRIYLIDVMLLDIKMDGWDQLVEQVFNNQQMMKIVFAPLVDLQMFQKIMPTLNLSTQLKSSFLDLQALWKVLLKIPPFKFPYQGDNIEQGPALNNLVQVCLGKKLDKSNQFSNWENRPLRPEQLTYAALDAYCLIEIYNVIEAQCKLANINFNELIADFLNNRKFRPNKSANKPDANNGKASDLREIKNIATESGSAQAGAAQATDARVDRGPAQPNVATKPDYYYVEPRKAYQNANRDKNHMDRRPSNHNHSYCGDFRATTRDNNSSGLAHSPSNHYVDYRKYRSPNQSGARRMSAGAGGTNATKTTTGGYATPHYGNKFTKCTESKVMATDASNGDGRKK